jgi:hypothetical protein
MLQPKGLPRNPANDQGPALHLATNRPGRLPAVDKAPFNLTDAELEKEWEPR